MPLNGSGRQPRSALSGNRQSSGGRALIACVVASLALFTLSSRMGEESPFGMVRGAFQTITSPVRYLGATVASPFRGIGNVVTNLTADQQTLTELQTENEQLKARVAELEEDAQTAERLQGLLDLRDVNNLQSTAARIISGSVDTWSDTVTIDKGTSSGVTSGMPVTSSSGVVGQVVESGAESSTVRLLTDENSSISAMVQSSRVQGMLNGSVTGQLHLTLIGSDQQVEVGDVIVTSGLGGVFPKGLPLGEVTSVESAPGALYLDIVVEPLSHAENYEEVLVITSLTEEQRAGADDIAAADAQDQQAASNSASGKGDEDAQGEGADETDQGGGDAGTQ